MNIDDIISIIEQWDAPRDRWCWITTDLAGDKGGLCRLLIPYIVAAWTCSKPVSPEAVDAAHFEAEVAAEPWEYLHMLDKETFRNALRSDNTIILGPFGVWYAKRRPTGAPQ